jgi:hypothetical protein
VGGRCDEFIKFKQDPQKMRLSSHQGGEWKSWGNGKDENRMTRSTKPRTSLGLQCRVV